MGFTFKEWNMIKHNMEVALNDYEKIMNDSKPSDDENSLYQIFKRQAEETRKLIEKIENAII